MVQHFLWHPKRQGDSRGGDAELLERSSLHIPTKIGTMNAPGRLSIFFELLGEQNKIFVLWTGIERKLGILSLRRPHHCRAS